MKGAPVLHWPKLFEGWVLTGEYRNHGDGDLSGDGMGGGYMEGLKAKRGGGFGDGFGDGKGSGRESSTGDGNGGGFQSYGNGNGYAKRSV
jgi:hypothetical protein